MRHSAGGAATLTTVTYPFLKGHGTENDFVLLPDLDGTVHGDLTPERVRALCDRRAGIGGDGVLRVLRVHASGTYDADWFMDYRNSDGSLSEMCGNGIRVFARYLVDEGLVEAGQPIRIATRAGVKVVTVDGDLVIVDLGVAQVYDESPVSVGERTWQARHVDVGNPHAVAFVGDLQEAGPLRVAPTHDESVYPHGVNVEFVVQVEPGHIAMRVHERGSGETRSCGTGAGAAMVATAVRERAPRGTTYTVDVPGGRLWATWTQDDRVLLSGPAVVVARGETAL